MKLSYRQMDRLTELHRRPDGYFGSCVEPTMAALERKGLVRLTWINVPTGNEDFPQISKERWVITDEGEALAKARNKPAPTPPQENDR